MPSPSKNLAMSFENYSRSAQELRLTILHGSIVHCNSVSNKKVLCYMPIGSIIMKKVPRCLYLCFFTTLLNY